MNGVLHEVATMARETLDLNRSESGRLKAEIVEVDKAIAGLTRVLIDPDIEAMAKKSIARQVAECEVKREQLREALEGVAVKAVENMDDLMADCRQAFLEAKDNFAGLMSPAQINRFIAEVVGPMVVMPDGRIIPKEKASKVETLEAVTIAGAGFEPTTSGL